MVVDHSKGRYRVIYEGGDLIGTINFESCIRLDGEMVYYFDDLGCIYDPKHELVGRIGNDAFMNLDLEFLYRIEPM
jgi:hypothetical protein